MATDRFYVFTQLIDGIHKCIYKMKIDFAPYIGVKSVHMFWIYELAAHPEGLTSAELAEKNMISRSLVSREIECLQKNGYIVLHENARGKRKNYNSRITLTEKGQELANHIRTKAMDIQSKVNEGIDEEELVAFYATMEKLMSNMQTVVREGDAAEKEAKTTVDCEHLHKKDEKGLQ
ncbi:MAG: winged helix-turn-helix transcriptional regulator [Clostridia bacterium]|nr:winged helix-turn-helix transcriptional regulator [Clostridia bacterium]